MPDNENTLSLAEELDRVEKSYRQGLLRVLKRHPFDPQKPDPAHARAFVLLLRQAAGNGIAQAELRKAVDMTQTQFAAFEQLAQENMEAAVETLVKNVEGHLRSLSGNAFQWLQNAVASVDKKKDAA